MVSGQPREGRDADRSRPDAERWPREIEAARTDGRWQAAYAPSSRIEVPPELAEALDAAPEAKRQFENLDRTNRYAILYRIQDAKRPETRVKRIAGFVAMLERGEMLHPRKAT